MSPFKALSLATACLVGGSLAVVVDCSTASAASLLGDTVQFDYFFPDLSSPRSSQSTTVVTGASDAFNYFDIFSLNPEASGFTTDFSSLGSGWREADFNGFILSSLNFDDNSSIVGFNLDTNMAGLDASRIAFTADTFSVNWQGLRFNSDTFVNVSFQTEAPAAIPTPALLPGLVGMGVAALRKRKEEVPAKA